MSLKLIPFVPNQAALPTGAQFTGYMFGVVDDDGLGNAGLRVYNGIAWTLIGITNLPIGGGGGVVSVTAGAGLTDSGTAINPIINAVSSDSSLTIGANDMVVAAAIQGGAALGATAVQPARQIIAGAGLTGGGSLAADRTLDVANVDGSLVVGANDVAVSAAIQAGAGLGATSVQSVTAGAGLVNSGTALFPIVDIVAANGTIQVNADSLQVGTISSANVDASIATTTAVDAIETETEKQVELMQHIRILLIQLIRIEMGGDLLSGVEGL